MRTHLKKPRAAAVIRNAPSDKEKELINEIESLLTELLEMDYELLNGVSDLAGRLGIVLDEGKPGNEALQHSSELLDQDMRHFIEALLIHTNRMYEEDIKAIDRIESELDTMKRGSGQTE